MEQDNRNKRGPKPDGKRKQPKFNKKGELPLSVDQLQKVRVNMPPGFAEAGMSIVVVFKATGTEVGLTKDPPKLSSLDDLTRLYAARRTISGIEAQEKKASNLSLQKSLIMRQIVAGKVDDLSKIPQRFSSELVRVMAQAMFIDKYKDIVKDVSERTETNKILKDFILSQIDLIYKNIEVYLNALMVGQDSNLNDLLRNAGVSQWLFNKLSASSIAVTATSSLEDFFFPKKAEKGFNLTVKELREPVLQKTHEFLLSRSSLLISAVSDAYLPRIINSDLNSFIDETNNEVKKTLKRVVYVVPITAVKEYARNHTESIKIPAEQDLLTRLNVKMISLVSGAFPLDMSQKESMLAYFGIKAESSATKSLRESFLDHIKEGKLSLLDLNDKLSFDAFKRHLKPDYPFFLGELDKLIPKKFNFVKIGVVPELKYFNKLNPQEIKLATSDRFKELKSLLDTRFVVKSRKRRESIPKSRISDEAKELFALLEKDEDYKGLIDDIVNYLLSFSDINIQAKAATLMIAEYTKKTFYDEKAEEGASDNEEIETQVDFW